MAPRKYLTVFFRRTGEWALGAIDPCPCASGKNYKNFVVSIELALSAMKFLFPLSCVVIFGIMAQTPQEFWPRRRHLYPEGG
jgi:hypothetical protein